MNTLNKQSAIDMDVWKRIEIQKKLDARKQRIAKRKEDNHRIFLIGKLVSEKLQKVQDIPVFKGKDSAVKNAASFAPLEKFLSVLVADENLMTLLDEEVNHILSQKISE